MVASLKPPRGMPAAVAPQFILLAHMGAVGRQAYDLIGSVTGTREINGCLVRGTMFATLEGTSECAIAFLAGPVNRGLMMLDGGAGANVFALQTWLVDKVHAACMCTWAMSSCRRPGPPASTPSPNSSPARLSTPLCSVHTG